MSIAIKAVPADQLRAWFDTINLAFGEPAQDEQWRIEQGIFEADRVLGAYDDERLVGGAAAYSLQLTVPGGATVPMAGVTTVGVLPTNRRQGILRQLMARQLADVRSSGEPLAGLWASEGGIYQRFGYGLATLNGSVTIDRERSSFRTPLAANGTFRLVDAAEAARLIPPVFDTVRAAWPGFYARHAEWWKLFLADPEYRRAGAGPKYFAVHERDGEVAGYVIYRIKPEWGDVGSISTLLVQELIGVDPAAIHQLWRYVFGVDLIAHIRLRLGPADHPLLLMLAEPRRAALRMSDGLWLRILDVPAALERRSYVGTDTIVLEVVDEFLPVAGGRFRLTAADGHARVVHTDDPPDLELDAADLAAVYLGGFSFASLSFAGRTREITTGAWSRADDLFRTPLRPWCPEIF